MEAEQDEIPSNASFDSEQLPSWSSYFDFSYHQVLLFFIGLVGAIFMFGWFANRAKAKRHKEDQIKRDKLLKARHRHLQTLESEADVFKQTSAYQELIDSSREMTEGVTSKHRHHTITKATDAVDGGPSIYFDHSIQGGARYTPSATDRYGLNRRRPGGGS